MLRELAEGMCYERQGERNVLTLRFRRKVEKGG